MLCVKTLFCKQLGIASLVHCIGLQDVKGGYNIGGGISV